MINFVENKTIDWENIQEILTISKKLNHWTNFGPVSQELEKYLEKRLNLAENLCVVMCCSGTAALHALVNMHNYLQPYLKWTVSSFGFACTIQGPLTKAHVVDCNNNGIIEFSQIQTNGVVVTNTFGTLAKFITNDLLIMDNAAAFDVEHCANSIISFHQTKPWGIGEGGCAIIEKKHKELFKSLINFGLTKDGTVGFATNAKISDINCACIWQRLLKMDTNQYKEQYHRIIKIAEKVGFKLLAECIGTPPNIPLISPKVIHNLDNPFIKLQKYYRPINQLPNATWLYDHIVNFPCHPEVGLLSNNDVETCLKRIIAS